MSEPMKTRRPPNEWWVGLVAGMAPYIDAAAIVANGIALVIYQFTIGITPDQIGVMSAALTICMAIGAFVGGRAGDRFGRRTVFIITMMLIVAGLIGKVGATLLSLYALVALAPGMAASVRRLHDTNRSGWWLLIWLVPIVGPIILLVFMAQGSQPNENQYGPAPSAALA